MAANGYSVRRNGQASPFFVAVSRRGACGGAVAGGGIGLWPKRGVDRRTAQYFHSHSLLTILLSVPTIQLESSRRWKMASEAALIAEIRRLVSYYRVWTIGVTDDPEHRMREHNNPKSWRYWDADTERIARNVEAYFLNEGMSGDTGGRGRADYVYIFITNR